MTSFHRVIGIDLGTTYSVVAVYDYNKQDARVLPNRQGELTTPSVVHIDANGHVKVGRAAKSLLARDPDGVVMEVKRIMGESHKGKKLMARARGRDLDPELLSAYILKELKACAEKAIGCAIHDAVITVPAYFTEAQKNATKQAAELARLNARLVINEPTAAAVAYGLESGEPQAFVVYDLGGGTFDVSVVRVEDANSVEVLGTGGNANLGGADIDQRIVKWALGCMQQQFGRDFSGDEKLRGKLRLQAEQVKILLCNEQVDQEFFVDAPIADVAELAYALTLATFRELCQPLLARTLEQIEVALASAKKNHRVTLDDVSGFILVGGSSKNPLVAELLTQRFNKPIRADLNPDEIVALGAARVACNFQPSLAVAVQQAELKLDLTVSTPPGLHSANIKDVVSHTLGVGLKDDVYDPLIPKDHVIPHRVVRGGYTTSEDNQTAIAVPVFQGDNPRASLNVKLGEVHIRDLSPEKRGTHQFQISFSLNADGLFEGEILHLGSDKRTPITLDRGDLALTHKKRLSLEALADANNVTPATDPKAPADVDIARAQDLLPTLPVTTQRPIREALKAIENARAAGDVREESLAHTALTLALAPYRP